MGEDRQFDAWSLAGRALAITWRHRPLWIFGFLASLGGRGVFGLVDEWGPASRPYLLGHPLILLSIIVVLVAVWLAIFVLNLIARGALIAGSDLASRGLGVSLDVTWRRGLRSLPRLLALVALAVAALIVVSVLFAVPLVLPLAAGAAGVAIAVVIGAVLVWPYLAFLFALAFTVTYAERAVVLDGAGVLDSLRVGWEIARGNTARTFFVWLVALVSALAYGVSLLIVVAAIALPCFVIGLASPTLALVLGVPLGLATVAVATGAFGCYSYALWTLAYRQLRGEKISVGRQA